MNWKQGLGALLVLGLSTAAFAGREGSGGTRGGGDEQELEFAKYGRTIVYYSNKLDMPEELAENLAAAIAMTRVIMVDKSPELAGFPERSAVNDPSALEIYYERQRWKDNTDFDLRAKFVMHEYLSILKMDDAHYDASAAMIIGPIIARAQMFPYDPEIGGAYDEEKAPKPGCVIAYAQDQQSYERQLEDFKGDTAGRFAVDFFTLGIAEAKYTPLRKKLEKRIAEDEFIINLIKQASWMMKDGPEMKQLYRDAVKAAGGKPVITLKGFMAKFWAADLRRFFCPGYGPHWLMPETAIRLPQIQDWAKKAVLMW